MKKTGVLLYTRSKLPSSVYNLVENPRGSLAVSGDPSSPPTVEKRVKTLVFFPTVSKNLEEQISVMSSVTSKTP